MTDRQAGDVAAIAGPSHGLEAGSENYITLFQKLLEDDLDEELLQAVSGNSDLTVYELIRKLQRRYTDSANVKNRVNLNKTVAREDQSFYQTTKLNAKHGLPNVSDFFISQEALERLASETEKHQSPPKSQNLDEKETGSEENVRPAIKKRTTKVGGSLIDESDNAMRQESCLDSAIESAATESMRGVNFSTHPTSFKVVSRDSRQLDEKSNESRNNEYRNNISFEDGQEESSEATKGYSQDSGNYSRLLGSNVDSATVPVAEKSPEKHHTCGSCGHDLPLKENGLCKNCWNRFKKDNNVRLGGTLDDFKAYAQCIAQSVRKMLDIRPAVKSSEEDDTQYDNIIGDQSEVLGDANRTTNEVVLHRFNTDQSLKSSPGKEKTVFNRSVSYDGQVSLPVREMKSLSPSKANAVPILSLDNRAKESLETKEVNKKPRTKISKKEDSVLSELETKTEEIIKTVSPRKIKTRKGGLERSKTSFDMKKVDIIPVSAKRQNSEKPDLVKRPQKTEKDIQNTLTVSKLLNEGTPVDSPRGKDKRARKAPVRRSSTIPLKKGAAETVAKATTSTVSDARESRSTTKSLLRKKRVNLSLADIRTEEVGKLDSKRRSTSYDVMVMSRPMCDDFMDRSKTSSPAVCEEKRDCRNKPKEVQALARENTSVYKPSPKQRTKLLTSRVAIVSPSEQVYSGATLKQAMSQEAPVEKPKYTEPPVPAPHGEKKRKTASEKDEAYCDGVKHLPVDLETQLNSDTSVAVTSDIYTVKEPAISKSSCQYFNALQPATSARDRSHESRSTHAMSGLRSSHSDDTLLRSQADVYYSRKGLSGETDVDTGLVHHFCKRQNARSQVLPYFEFASGKNMYTSGDVSVSESSNSGTSLKSVGSENIYTGGFFKEETTCDQEINGGDNNGDNVSVSSVSQIYFDPPQDSQKGEPSEHDLYTGGVFSTNQNANGSMNNSTRPLLSRVSRRYRGRPKIDRVLDRNMEITGIVQYKTPALYQPMEGVNCSNNSSSNGPYYNFGASEQRKTPSPRITQSDSSSYTGFGYRYQVQSTPQPKSDFKGIIDFSKYEAQETANTGFFFQTPKKIESDDIWYRGPYTSTHLPPSTMEQHVEYPSASKFPQHHDDDDCYTNIICPKFRNSNNNASSDVTEPEDPDDANNNHFYTDDYTPDPSDANGATGSVFYEETSSKYAPQSNFFLKSGVNTPQSPHNAFSHEDRPYSGSSPSRSYVPGFYGHPESAYAPPFSFSNVQQGPPEVSSFNKSASYGNAEHTNTLYSTGQEDSWGVYEQSQQRSQGVCSSDYVEMPRHRYGDEPANSQSERDSYFDYAASRNPSAGLFMDKRIDDFSSFMPGKSPPIMPVVNEIKKVGGIVCRENVVNKEDYAEDVNRDLMDEPGAWVSYRYRDDEPKFVKELGGGRGAKMNNSKETVGKLARAVEDSSYAHNKIYDNVGARNNWREMNNDHSVKVREPKDSSRQKQQQPGKAPEKKEKNVWRPSDQIPERAMGKRSQNSSKPATVPATPAPQQQQAPIPPTILDGNNNTSQPDTARNPSSANTLSKCSSKKVNNSSGLDKGKQSIVDSESKQVLVDEMVFISPPDVPSNSHSENLKTTWNLKPEPSMESTHQEKGLMDCRIM